MSQRIRKFAIDIPILDEFLKREKSIPVQGSRIGMDVPVTVLLDLAAVETRFSDAVGFRFRVFEYVEEGLGMWVDGVTDLEEVDEGVAELEAAEGGGEVEVAVGDVVDVEVEGDGIAEVGDDAAAVGAGVGIWRAWG